MALEKININIESGKIGHFGVVIKKLTIVWL